MYSGFHLHHHRQNVVFLFVNFLGALLFIQGTLGLFCSAHAQSGVQFYVDQTHGNDANDGQSQATAWRTLSKANSSHTSCSTVNILPGEYRESIFPKSGAANCRTVYQGLGNRADIIILGSNQISTWTPHSGNIYVASFRNDANPRCDSGTRDTDCWQDRTRLLTPVSSIAEVNSPGEFYYNYSNGQVHLWTSDSQPPSAHKIECTARKVAPLYSSQSADQPAGYVSPTDFTIQNLTIMHSYDDGITFGGSNVTIANNDIGYNSGGGSCASNPSGVIHHKSSQLSTGVIISGNYIHDQVSDSGLASLTGILGHSGSGIELYSTNGAIVESNTVTRVAEALYVKSGYQPECYRNSIIRNNIAHDVAAGVIFYNGGTANTNTGTAEGNILYNIGGKAIISLNDNSGVRIYNNSIWNSQGIAIEKFGPAGENFSIRNNAVSNVPAAGEPIGFIALWWGTLASTQSDRNLFWNTQSAFGVTDLDASGSGATTQSYSSLAAWRSATALDANSVNANPLFTNPSAGKLGLGAGSPAIDAGTVIAGFHCPQTDDVNPNQTGCRHWLGAAPDIGAHEFGTPLICFEQWSCADWSSCSVAGTRTRTCTDVNSCGTVAFRPSNSQNCLGTDTGPPGQPTDLRVS